MYGSYRSYDSHRPYYSHDSDRRRGTSLAQKICQGHHMIKPDHINTLRGQEKSFPPSGRESKAYETLQRAIKIAEQSEAKLTTSYRW
ncbi:MAG: hypothetical protein V1900_01065 [Candidatus Aenigmatarchaeota archaeon]